jgi:hypothetical protein
MSNGLITSQAPPTRRRLLKHAMAGAVGAGAASKLLSPDTARAAGTSPAYTDADNTFTGDQRFDGRLGIGTAPSFPLHVRRANDPGWAAKIETDWNGLVIGHSRDLSSAGTGAHDVIDLFLRSTGDGIFGAHLGGVVSATSLTAVSSSGSTTLSSVSSFDGLVAGTGIAGTSIPSGTTIVSTNPSAGTLVMTNPATESGSTAVSISPPSGGSGGNAMFNALIPYFLDDAGDGRHGSITNNRGGMLGLRIASQARRSAAINVDHSGDGPAVFIRAQDPAWPQGAGGPISLVDYSTASSITILKGAVPKKAVINVSAPGVGETFDVLRINDSAGNGRLVARNDGTLALGLEYPYHSPTGAKLQVETTGAGMQRSLALTNSRSVGEGDGTQIEFRFASSQWALMQAVVDSASPPKSSLRFKVRDSSFSMVERLRLDGTGVGFHGAPPVAQPVVSGSRGGNAALTQLLNALAKIGLIKDTSTT